MRRLAVVLLFAACGRIDFATAPILPDGSGRGSDVGPENFCATVTPTPNVCSDFDEGQPIETGWTTTVVQDKGSIALSDVGNASPHGLTAAFGDQPGMNDQSIAYLSYVAPGTTVKASLEFDMEIAAPPAAGDYEVCDIAIQVGTMQFFNDLDIYATGTDAYREEYEVSPGMFMIHTTPFPLLTTGVWHHILIDIDLEHQTHSFEVDHTAVDAGPTFYPQITPGAVRFEGGLDFASGVLTGASFDLDNIVIRAD